MALVPNENSPAQDSYQCSSDRDQGAYSLCPIRGVARGQSGAAVALLGHRTAHRPTAAGRDLGACRG